MPVAERLRDIVVVGGGCYGTFYAGQLARAAERGALAFRRVLLVDRDPRCRAARELPPAGGRELVVEEWGAFFDRWLAEAEPDDAIVPSPLMPHLMMEWLERRARAAYPGRAIAREPIPLRARTPFEQEGADGTRYLSHADWLCPVHCIEPATCPMTSAPRTWEMRHTVERLGARIGATETAAFLCRHRAYGVGMFGVDELLAGEAAMRRAGGVRGGTLLVATVSRCHGAATLLGVGGERGTGVGYQNEGGAEVATR